MVPVKVQYRHHVKDMTLSELLYVDSLAIGSVGIQLD